MSASTPFGIPEAEFIDDIAAVAPTVEACEKLIQEKQTMFQKYRLLENHLLEKQQQLKENRPGIADNLDAVTKLEAMAGQGEKDTHFQISESVYGTAKVNSESSVALWLGANVMVEYPFEEAKELLQVNLNTLDNQIKENEERLRFVRDQITTTEVTMSRVMNQLIYLRKK